MGEPKSWVGGDATRFAKEILDLKTTELRAGPHFSFTFQDFLY